MRPPTVLVLAKEPVPGLVKTRLVPPLTYDDAARLAAAALLDTLDAVDRTPVSRRVLAFRGDASAWARPGWAVTSQPAGGLDVRIAAALAVAAGPAVLIGMDTPQLRPEHLAAFDHVRYDAALGLAPDGGFWALGLREPAVAAAAVLGVPMSTEHTGADQLARLHALGLKVQLLDVLADVDTVDVAERVADLAPSTRFAAALAAARVRPG